MHMDLATIFTHAVVVAAVCAALVNIPFGFWRAGTRRFSALWFMAVHAPIPLIVAIRLLMGVGWRITTFPLFLAAYLGGQLVGGAVRRHRQARS
jgi:hypothetical protein